MDGAVREDFAAYVAARGTALVRTAYLLTGDVHAAEDLAQATFARLLPRWGRVCRDGNVEAYVRRVMVSVHASWWRRRSSWERPTETLPDQPVPDLAGAVVDRRALAEALRALPVRQRAAVVLRYFDELTEAQAALVLGCSIGSVKTHTSRGLARLRREFADPAEALSDVEVLDARLG